MFPERGGPLYDIVFSPMTDAMSVVRKNKRQKVADSFQGIAKIRFFSSI